MSLTSALGQLEIVRVVDEKPADLKEYGLAAPRIEIEFKSQDGKPSGKAVGRRQDADQRALYAKRNDEPRVFLIQDYLEGSLNKSTFDLRDKTHHQVERDKIDGVEVNRRQVDPIRQERQRLEDHHPARGARRFLGRGRPGRPGRKRSDEVDRHRAGDAGRTQEVRAREAAVTVTIKQGSARAVLAIGRDSAGDDTVYARDMSRPLVVTIDKSLADDLKKGPTTTAGRTRSNSGPSMRRASSSRAAIRQ